MGDVRYVVPYERLRDAKDRAAALRGLADEEVVSALAAASREGDPLLANVLATEAHNRLARTQRVFSSMGDALFEVSWPERQITSVNRAAELMSGWSREELRGGSVEPLFQDRADFLQLGQRVASALERDETLHGEERLRRKDGTPFTAEYTITSVRNAMGEVVSTLSLWRDITVRKEAEAALRESEERYRQATVHSAIGMALVDPTGRFLQVNEALRRIVGYDEDELLDLSFQAITHPADLDKDLALAKRLAAGEIPSYTLEKRYVRKDGQLVWIELTGSAVRAADGTLLYFIAQVQDIDARKRMERRLGAQNGVARALADADDPDEAIKGSLRAFCGALGWARGEFWRMDAAAEGLRLAVVHPATGASPSRFEEESRSAVFRVGEGLPGLVWERGGPMDIPDVSVSAQFSRRESAVDAQLRAAFGFPVKAGARVVGVMVFFDRAPRELDDELRATMEVIGEEVGNYLERREAERRTSELLAAAPDATLLLDARGRFVLLNARAERLLGRRQSDLLGTPAEDLLPERIRAAQPFRAPRGPGVSESLESTVVTHDGVEIPVEISRAAMETSEGRFTVVTLRPMLELRRPATGRPVPALVRRLHVASRAASALVVLIGALVLAGWMLDIAPFLQPIPGAPLMTANTAAGLLLSGAAAWLLGGRPGRSAGRAPAVAALAAGILVAAMGALTLFEHATGVALGIDDLIVRDPSGLFVSPVPGRPSPQTALAFAFAGPALALLALGRRRGLPLAQALGLGVGTLALFALTGYLFGVAALYVGDAGAPYAGMAPHTAVGVGLLGFALLASRPAEGLVRIVVSDSAGGALARRFAAVILLVPLILGVLALWGERAGLYDSIVAITAFSLASVLLLGIALWGTARSIERQEQRSRQAETLFGGILASSPDAVVITDARGRIRYVNEETDRTFGYRAGELLGLPVEVLVPQASRRAHVGHRADYSKTAQRRPMGEAVDLHGQRKDGTLIPVEISLSTVSSGEGELVMATVRDVTERRRAARRTEEVRRLFSAVAEASQTMARAPELAQLCERVCAVVVEEARFRAAVIRVLEKGTGRLLSTSSSEKGMEELAELIAARAPTGRETLVVNDVAHDPAATPWRGVALAKGCAACATFPIAGSEGVIGALTVFAAERGRFEAEEVRLLAELAADLALAFESLRRKEELRRVERAIDARVTERTRALAHANRELEAFTYRVSHDLRAPLRGVSFFLEDLERQPSQLDADAREQLDRASRETRRMGQLIEDLLAFSRSGMGEIERARVDLSAVARDVLSRLAERDPRRRVEVAVQEGLAVEADPGLVRVALENLIGNAWKFSSMADPARIEVGVAPASDGHPAAYYVRDNGAGFAQDNATRLFEPFQRFHRPEEFEGTGVGLATVARIVRRHGGEVWAQSARGKGATFFFTLSSKPIPVLT